MTSTVTAYIQTRGEMTYVGECPNCFGDLVTVDLVAITVDPVAVMPTGVMDAGSAQLCIDCETAGEVADRVRRRFNS